MVHVQRGTDESDYIALVTRSSCDSDSVRKSHSANAYPNYRETGDRQLTIFVYQKSFMRRS